MQTLHKLMWLLGLALLLSSFGFADIPSEVPIYAPNPGDPPPEADQIRHGIRIRYAIGGAFVSAAIIASGFVWLRNSRSQKPARIQDWYLVVGVTAVAGIIVGLVALAATPPTTTEFLEWEKKHAAWKRGDVIGVTLETPKRRGREEHDTGEMIAD